uniref:PNT domain-containing protein n=1 Tax=Anopheles christyi TaxID=43041 RepID=A0A182KGK1_9DIPT
MQRGGLCHSQATCEYITPSQKIAKKLPSRKLKMQVESATKWRVPPLDLSAVSVLTNEAERRWNHVNSNGASTGPATNLNGREASNGHQQTASIKKIQYGADGLPIDPRDWTRANVWTWLINLAQSEGLDISPELAQKFPMNGKALCLMSLDMYLSRVPIGGKMLYRDFRVRLARAMSL